MFILGLKMPYSHDQPRLFERLPKNGTKITDILAVLAMKEINRAKEELNQKFRARLVASAPVRESVAIHWVDEPPGEVFN